MAPVRESTMKDPLMNQNNVIEVQVGVLNEQKTKKEVQTRSKIQVKIGLIGLQIGIQEFILVNSLTKGVIPRENNRPKLVCNDNSVIEMMSIKCDGG